MYIVNGRCCIIVGEKGSIESKHSRVGRPSTRNATTVNSRGSSLRLFLPKSSTPHSQLKTSPTTSNTSVTGSSSSPSASNSHVSGLGRGSLTSRQPRVRSPGRNSGCGKDPASTPAAGKYVRQTSSDVTDMEKHGKNKRSGSPPQVSRSERLENGVDSYSKCETSRHNCTIVDDCFGNRTHDGSSSYPHHQHSTQQVDLHL